MRAADSQHTLECMARAAEQRSRTAVCRARRRGASRAVAAKRCYAAGGGCSSAPCARPASSASAFGIFSLSFFIHNAVMTIMRGAAEPKKNKRNMTTAFSLTWFCYASMGVSANLLPPMGILASLSTDAAKSGMLSMFGLGSGGSGLEEAAGRVPVRGLGGGGGNWAAFALGHDP